MCVRASVVLMQCTLGHHSKFVRASCVKFDTLLNNNKGQIRLNLISHVFTLNMNFPGYQFLVEKSVLNGRNGTVFALHFCGPPILDGRTCTFAHQVSPQCSLSILIDWTSSTHLCLVVHICVSESGQHWFREWLVTYSAPSHYLNRFWAIVYWTLGVELVELMEANYEFHVELIAHITTGNGKDRFADGFSLVNPALEVVPESHLGKRSTWWIIPSYLHSLTSIQPVFVFIYLFFLSFKVNMTKR